jgi:hypothetical protein
MHLIGAVVIAASAAWGLQIAWALPSILAAKIIVGCSVVAFAAAVVELFRSRPAGWLLLGASAAAYCFAFFWFGWTTYLGPALIFALSGAVALRRPHAPPPDSRSVVSSRAAVSEDSTT